MPNIKLPEVSYAPVGSYRGFDKWLCKVAGKIDGVALDEDVKTVVQQLKF